MELEFTAEHEELRAAVRTVLGRECPISLVRDVVETGSQPEALWKQMVALDWPALTMPTATGGLGGGFLELTVVAEELGRAICPGPLLPTISQYAPAVRELATPAQAAVLLGQVASGNISGTLALAESAMSWRLEDIETVARPVADGWTLHGVKKFVMEAGDVDEIAVVARREGTRGLDGLGVWVVPSTACAVAPLATLDASRSLATVTLDGVTVPAERALAGPNSAAALERAVQEATVAIAAETAGVCQMIFEIALQYAKDRQQFGVPIGSFQAMKHKFATMFIALERARSIVSFAAATIAEDDPRRGEATSMAKAAIGDCQALLAQQGIQSLGGIGYTWEHDMHLYVKRETCDSLFGAPRAHRQRVAAAIGL